MLCTMFTRSELVCDILSTVFFEVIHGQKSCYINPCLFHSGFNNSGGTNTSNFLILLSPIFKIIRLAYLLVSLDHSWNCSGKREA